MISIAIPTYEMNGVGCIFLKKSLELISLQTFKDFEVVISDHSIDDSIKNICEEFKDSLKIIYLRNEVNRGSSSSNMNNAILNCKGEIIKFLFQDEYLYKTNCLEDIKNYFDNNGEYWLITGCSYGESPDQIIGNMIPRYEDKSIIQSINTIGSPSVVSIRNRDLELFGDNLLWIMDCDYYKRVFDRHGEPGVLADNKVFICQHKNQVSNLIDSGLKIKEENYLKNKYQYES
jgi:glycosyltransferase involved in cell wall biosynthesis